jgi:hypothetical protein
MQPSPLANPLATVVQLKSSGSQLDGIPQDLEDSIRYAGARLTQAAGILLRLPQEVIAQAVIVFMRFWVGEEGGSLAEFGAGVGSLSSAKYTSTDNTAANFSLFALPRHEAFCISQVGAQSHQRLRLPRCVSSAPNRHRAGREQSGNVLCL